MNRRQLFNVNYSGDTLAAWADTSGTQSSSYDYMVAKRLPLIPYGISDTVDTAYAVAPGETKVTLTFTATSVTVADATTGVGTKILDFPLGSFRFKHGKSSLTFTTTSTIASTLNASKTILWSLGSVTQSTGTLTGGQSDILSPVPATSSATISVANTATVGRVNKDITLYGPSTAGDVFLNIGVPTATDIDADATVEINGTVTLVFEDLGTAASTITAANSRAPSAGIWANCPWDAINRGEVDGLTYFNDFTGRFAQAANVAATATTVERGVAFTGATAGSTITQETDEPYGSMALNCTTDNETVCYSDLGGQGAAGQIVFEAGKKLWFEARIKVDAITDDLTGLFCGFGEEGLCVTVGVIGADDALTDKDLVGFHKNADDAFTAAASLDFIYNTASGGTSPVKLSTVGTMVADTYVKVGIYCDGTTVYVYVDGTVNATSYALTATDFPDGEEMAFYFAITNKGGGDAKANIDWVKVAQTR